MLRHFRWCAFIIVGLLLLAGLLAAHEQVTVRQRQAHHIGRVAQAVTHLDGGCFNCHSSLTGALTNAYPATAIHQLDQPRYSYAATELLSGLPSQTNIDVELVDLGEHILALDEQNNARTNDAAQAYLQLHDETRNIATMSDRQLQSTLQRIAGLKDMLKVLENQASPVKWNPQGVQRQTSQTNAIIPVPLSASADVPRQNTLIGVYVAPGCTLMRPHQFRVPREVAFSVQRRGPPADVHLVSGQDGRLLSSDMQSPFILPYRLGGEREQWHV